MLNNYFKIAWRLIFKNKIFSAINIIGLSIGTLCCLYILLYVKDQFSYDNHHENVSQIFRVTTSLNIHGDKHTNATCSPPIAPAMKRDFPEVSQYARVVSDFGSTKHLLKFGDKSIYETDAAFVDSTFFSIFSYHFIAGSKNSVLLEPYTIVLQKNISDKLFGNENPVGKNIEINDENGIHMYTVTGVVDETLGKSHLKINIFIAMNSGGIGDYVIQNNSWAGNNFTNTYIKLYTNTNAQSLESKLPAFLLKYGADQLKEFGMKKELLLQPITTIHTTIGKEAEMTKAVNPKFLNLLLLIAFMIQLIACINFMNLSTARATKRATEVGVRKVIGAQKNDLLRQFLAESILFSFFGVLVAIPLLAILLPTLNHITNTTINLHFLLDMKVWLSLSALILVNGVLAGSYPAFYLTAFEAVKVIKGNYTNRVSAATIRKSLVVFQFVLSGILISSIIIIYLQLKYIQNKDLGFDSNQILVFNFYNSDTKNKISAFSDDLLQMSEVKNSSKATNYLGQFVPRDHGVFLQGDNMANAIDARIIISDDKFVNTNGINLIAGRDLHEHDTDKVLINETLMHKLGLQTDNAPGTRLYTQYEPDPATFVEVAGVMKDFNYNSLHSEIKPLLLSYDPGNADLSRLIVSVESANYKNLLNKIADKWKTHFQTVPFEYAFLDDEIQKLYETEATLSSIINLFTLLAILISSLGLFGLVTFSAEQKRKEIGVRKVLGAGLGNIVSILLKEFATLVFLAFIISIPFAWYIMNKWLQDYSYKITISWWMFAFAGVGTMFIALATVSYQALKAGMTNPVKSLRTE
ncbi:MAG: FtsX-like permease family protein [Saprospiraceae bacterium]